MHRLRQMFMGCACAASCLPVIDRADAQVSRWVRTGATGRLIYAPDAQGDRILDFSNVGYQGRGVELVPNDVPTVRTVSPVDGDDTATIQAAIDQVEALPLQANGYRGAVLLTAGHYDIATQLNINASGVVLRGVGRGEDGSVLHARGTSQRALVNIAGSGSQALTGAVATMVDKVVPAGANSFRVNSTSGLAVGQTVRVRRPGTQAWVNAVEGNLYNPPWNAADFDLDYDRVITRIEGNRVFVDAPLATSFDQQYGGGQLQRYTWNGRIQNVGVENLRAESDFDPTLKSGADFIDNNHSWTFVTINRAQNVWVRDSLSKYFAYASVQAATQSKWVAVDNMINLEPVSEVTGGLRYTYDLDGQMAFVTGSTAEKGRHDFVNNGAPDSAGPNVFHRSTATNARSETGPHRRWSTGTLFDNITVQGNAINVYDRANFGTSHGWSGANMVVWNSQANSFRVESPPTSQNWLIGSIGTNQATPDPGYYDSHGTKVTAGGVTSLYEAQANDSADLRSFHWVGGSGVWSDAMAWRERATPGVYEVSLRDYMFGDIDNFTLDGGVASVDDAPIDPAWSSAIAAASAAPIAGFDRATATQNAAFTMQHTLDPGERVIHGFLAMSLKQSGGSTANDFVQLIDADPGHRLSYSSLGWAGQVNATTPFVGVIDMGPYLPQLQIGSVNAWVSDNSSVDWAIYTIAVATPKADAVGAAVFLDGGVSRLDTAMTIGSLTNGGPAVSQFVLSPAGKATVTGTYRQDSYAKVVFEISGPGPAQVGDLAIGGQALLDGKAEVRLVDGYAPAVGATFDLIAAAGGFGGTRFDEAVAVDPATNATWGLLYTPTTVAAQLLSLRYGDLNHDGLLNPADWTIYVAGVHTNLVGLTPAQAYERGDLNNDGVNDLVDFSLFARAYDQANGSGAFVRMTRDVPEPGTGRLSLLSFVLVGLLFGRSKRPARSGQRHYA